MLRKALAVTILGIAILLPGLATSAHSEEPSSGGLQKLSSSVNRSVNQLGKDVNKLGKDLFGLVRPKEKEEQKHTTRPQQGTTRQRASYTEMSTGRAGSVFNRYRTPPTQGQTTSKNPNTALVAKPEIEKEPAVAEDPLPDNWPYVNKDTDTSRNQTETTTPSEIRLFSSDEKTTTPADDSKTETSTRSTTSRRPSYIQPSKPQPPQPRRSETSSTKNYPTNTQSASPVNQTLPLHQRLQTLRQSPFKKSYAAEKTTPQTQTNTQTTTTVNPTEAKALEPTRSHGETSLPQMLKPSTDTNTEFNQSSSFPNSQPRRNPKRNAVREKPTEPVVATPSRPIANNAAKTPAVVPAKKDNVLFQRDCPVLNVQTTGPSKINIGREAKYKIVLANQADVTAHEVLVTIDLPEWADVVGTEAEQGTAAIDRSASSRRLCWRLESLPGKSQREMTLKLIPRERRPIELAVRSTFTQIASQAVIEVQEPQLAMRLIGPKQVELRKAELFKLEINNSGNGTAEDMVLTLMPLTKAGVPTTHKLGNLKAGGKRTIDLELTAQQLDNVSVEANLKCSTGDGAKLIEKLTVLAPEIKTGVFGPAVRFLGTKGIYQIKIANFGNFAAKNLEVRVAVPPQAKFINGSEGVKFEKAANTAVWKLSSLNPGKETALKLECEMIEQGTARLIININDGKYTELSKIATIRVEAMADLTMKIVDPQGPVSIGEEAVYEIHIRNQGTRRAETVNAIAYFSEGIEPVAAEGTKHRITPGQVAFQTIDAIPPNEEVVLKVRAVAETTGNHMFRAETECVSLGTKLIGEETTHFYRGTKLSGDRELGPNSGSRQLQPPPQTSQRPRQMPRAADRRNEPTLAPQRSGMY